MTGFPRGDTISTVSLRVGLQHKRYYCENRISGNPVAVRAMSTSQNNKTVGGKLSGRAPRTRAVNQPASESSRVLAEIQHRSTLVTGLSSRRQSVR